MNARRPILSALAAALLLSLAPVAALRAELSTWTNLDGQAMQAEFVGRKGDYVSFKKADGSRYLYPYAKLSEADRSRVDALAQSNPALILSPVADSATPAPTPAPATPPAAPAGKLASALSGKLVEVKGSSLAASPRDRLDGARYVAVYYSAHWCPPCRAFTPELVKAYRQIKAKHPEFELVFVSSDRSENDMKGYMTEYDMAWPALDFDKKRSTAALDRPSNERGIPNLVFMDADGKELSLSYTKSGDYLGPQKVLADIRKHFRM